MIIATNDTTIKLKGDLFQIEKQLKELTSKPIRIPIQTEAISGSASPLAPLLHSMQTDYDQIRSIADRLQSIQLRVGGLDSGALGSNIQSIATSLQDLQSTYQSTMQSLSTGLPTGQFSQFQAQVEGAKQQIAQLSALQAQSMNWGKESKTEAASGIGAVVGGFNTVMNTGLNSKAVYDEIKKLQLKTAQKGAATAIPNLD